MELIIGTDGGACAVYDVEMDLTALGDVQIRRASHVEPDVDGAWWADLSPEGGPGLGPFTQRSSALRAEIDWLHHHMADI